MQVIEARGMRMPKLGLGTWRMTGASCTDSVLHALELGYRHVDTAQMYANEAEVGAALAQARVRREDIHLTTKVWWENLAPDALRRACAESLRLLRQDYVDLYLIHWPSPTMDLRAALETMMALQQEGKVRAIGVSNFTVALLRQAVEEVGAPIGCNQVEYHVNLDQSKLLAAMRGYGIPLTAYCPLGRGGLGDDAVLKKIGAKYGVTPEQVALAWLLEQDGVAAIPKASSPENQRANLAAAALKLDDADRQAIAALPKNHRIVSPAGFAPAWD